MNQHVEHTPEETRGTNMSDHDDLWKQLRAPFPVEEVELLPKPLGGERNDRAPRVECKECGGRHVMPAVHLSYVGHAGITMRLNEVVGPDGWDWEPMALTEQETPLFSDGGLWIRLTILGHTKIGYGDANGKRGPAAVKEIIGDAIRNAAMRFGIGTYLWSKSEKAQAMLARHGQADEPADEDDAQPAAPAVSSGRGIKPQQRDAIRRLSAKAEISDESEGLYIASQAVGREVKSLDDLTYHEAGKVIQALNEEIRRAQEAEAKAAANGHVNGAAVPG